jgi:alkyl hydroperoxide reductase subunit AhpC
MMRKYAVRLAVLMGVLAPVIGRGGPIGEPAAPLVVKEWIKGKPVEIKAGTNIFVVEVFTASTMASRASITTLNELQRRFKDQGVVVVGISDEPAERLKGFLADAGAAIEYAVAADNGRKTTLSYMMPVGKRGVPYAFVVGRDGKLQWHGHPQQGLAEALEQVTAGRYDTERAVKAELAWKQMGEYINRARRRDPRAEAAGRAFLANWTNDLARLCDLAYEIATEPRIAKRDFALANETLDRAAQLPPTNSARVAVTRAMVLFEGGKKEEGEARAREALASTADPKEKAYVEALLRKMEARLAAASTNAAAQKDPARTRLEQTVKEYFSMARGNNPKAGGVGRELLGLLTNDPVQLCELALGIATDRHITNRDLTLAGDALAQAEKVAPTNSTRVAVTRAIVLFESGGQKEEYLTRAQEALGRAKDPQEIAYAQNCVSTMQWRLRLFTESQIKEYVKEYLTLAQRSDPQAHLVGRQLLGVITNDVVRLCNLAYGIATDRQLTNRDFALASEALALADKASPKNSPRVVATQALVLCDSGGQKEECLARAREAFASTPEDSEEKVFVEACLHTIESRLEAAKTNQTAKTSIEAGKTNQTSKPAARP